MIIFSENVSWSVSYFEICGRCIQQHRKIIYVVAVRGHLTWVVHTIITIWVTKKMHFISAYIS